MPTPAPTAVPTPAPSPDELETHGLGHCLTPDVAYVPLDMLGEWLTYEGSAAKCQERCLHTPGCKYFTFYSNAKMCHVADEGAHPQAGSIGVISGPAVCRRPAHQEVAAKFQTSLVQIMANSNAIPAYAVAVLVAGLILAVFAVGARSAIVYRSERSEYLAPDAISETALLSRWD